jgi:hypothetical protein
MRLGLLVVLLVGLVVVAVGMNADSVIEAIDDATDNLTDTELTVNGLQSGPVHWSYAVPISFDYHDLSGNAIPGDFVVVSYTWTSIAGGETYAEGSYLGTQSHPSPTFSLECPGYIQLGDGSIVPNDMRLTISTHGGAAAGFEDQSMTADFDFWGVEY